ncbi:MAG: LacI family DNA-binding transcriptional regulator [Prevotella sp.]|nr:LacI family DNA-binding transcriptional regulator [Prevotella sp.]
MNKKIRIKDIAERAGVSVGTVDRVLHNRPNVSPSALEKVNRALEEMNYQPNMYASALAYNRNYTFICLMPKHASEAYWEEIEEGAMLACEARRDFHVDVKMLYYQRFHDDTFLQACDECLSMDPDGVVIVPDQFKITKSFTDRLHERSIPFVLLDSYMPDLKPLSFYGQDSFASGSFAAKMLMLIAKNESEVMMMKRTLNGRVASQQQENRELGFRRYMKAHYPHVKINEVHLPLDEDNRDGYDDILEQYFTNHPKTHHCITFCSKAHIVGDFLLRSHRNDVQIAGYDMVQKNANCLRSGSISFLIAQHAYMQGYYCVEVLFRAIVLKTQVTPVNYMPIEILYKENVDFYQRTMI